MNPSSLRRLSPLAVLAIALAATALVTAYVWFSAEDRNRLRFGGRVDRAATSLDRRLTAYTDILVGTAGLFAASGDVTADGFALYVESLRVQERYPGIQGIGFSARVPMESRDSLVEAQRRTGFADFRVWPEPRGEDLHAIVYLLPQDERNREAMGFDMFSNPVRREAMERARDTGRPAASGRVTLVQEIDADVQPGFLIYVPVYGGQVAPTTVADRRERLTGFVYSPFRAGDLLSGVLGADTSVDMRVYDGPLADPGALLFDSREDAPGDGDPRYRRTVSLEVAGRPWTAVVASGAPAETRSGALLALALGLLVSAALVLVTAAEARAQERAERATSALRASESQYRMAFEASPHPMWIYDRETLEFLAVNDAAVRHYGYSREEFGERTVRDIRPPEEVAALDAHLRELAGRSGPAVWRHVKRGGEVILVEVSSNDLDFSGRRGRLVLAHDVTEEVRSRTELEETQGRLRRILGLTPAVIYTMEVQGGEFVTSWVTENLGRVTGYTVEEGLTPGWWVERLHPDDRAAVLETAGALFEGGQRTVEYRFRHAGGDYIWIRDDALVRRDRDGEPVEVIGAWLDVTERRKLEAQFEQAQKMEAVGRLAGGIAHDFNNILTVIRSHTDMLLLDLPQGPVSSEIEVIQQAADRAARLTSQLLAFSRAQVLRPQLVDPARAIRELGQLLHRVLGEDIVIRYELPDEVPAIEVDPGLFEQALMNLAVNARDAMPAGGTLTFTAREERVGESGGGGVGDLTPGRYTVLGVTDTGTGMDDRVSSRIFEPFFTTKPKDRGTGLGLAMVYGFIRQSRGTIQVETAPGRGTTFRLYLPAADGTASPDRSFAEPAPAGLSASGRVLLVEDDASVRRATRKILERSGLTVVDVDSAEAGLEALGDGAVWDLVLTDLVLPGMSGRELVDHARSRRPDLPIVMMSGYEEASPVPRVELPGDVGFVGKPFTAERLLEVIRGALRA